MGIQWPRIYAHIMKSTPKKTYLKPHQLTNLAELQRDLGLSESKTISALIDKMATFKLLNSEMYWALISGR